MFKKRKRVTNKRESQLEIGEELDSDELASRPTKQSKKAGITATKQEPQTIVEQYRFESSLSAVPAGKTDQGATVDTVADKADAVREAKENKRAGISCRFDYQPDICKDWKETGYCGYGESCKFLHDRSDYKAGWQIEAEYEADQRRKRDKALYGGSDSEDSKDTEYFIPSDDEETLPFACLKCRGDFVSPVFTRCKHYFCEACAVEHYKKDPRCFVCKEPTGGQFNVAYDIIKKLEQKAAKASNSEEGSGGEGDDSPDEAEEKDPFSEASEEEDKLKTKLAPRPKGVWAVVQ